MQDAGDVNGDGYPDIIAGAPANNDQATNAGKAYVYSGLDGSTLFVLLGEVAGDNFGAAVAGVGDIDADGRDDVIIGAPYHDLGGAAPNAGRAFIFYGRSSSVYPVNLSAVDADLVIDGELAGDNFGWDVAPLRDVNGDTMPDFLVGARGRHAGTEGKVYAFSGADRSVIHTFVGEAANDSFGNTTRDAGDVDADGLPDIIVGAVLNDGIGVSAGRAYVYSGANGNLLYTLDGEAAGDNFGIWVGGAGDVDQDGHDDLIVGAHLNDAGGTNAGRAYVFSGADASVLRTLTGDESFGFFGASVASVADLDGDGIGDLAVGAYGHGVPGRLRAGAVRLHSSATGALLDKFGGSADGDQFGRSVYPTPDSDGDDVRDLLVGANLNDEGGPDGGRVTLYSPGDADADGFRAVCDNCRTTANPDQSDTDFDSVGDVCDNCPVTVNPGQEDLDGDELGDTCDPCPADAFNDIESDSWCADVDNCAEQHNPLQLDDDGDLVGNVCDHCPADHDGSDVDGDGAADGCDCQPLDPGDLPPGEVPLLQAGRGAGGTTMLSWTSVVGADVYSITRGSVSMLALGSYGDCLASGLLQTGYEDHGMPTSGDGFAYLVQGESLECGLGLLGSGSSELLRENMDPLACSGSSPFSDAYPAAELPVLGTVSGGLADVGASDGTAQSITEELSSGGSPDTRFSQLEHRWEFSVPAGSRIELHLEGYRSQSSDGDDFRFEYWEGDTWTAIEGARLPLNDDGDSDAVIELPPSVSGTLTIRVVDTVRDPGTQALDTVSIDELFVRSIP